MLRTGVMLIVCSKLHDLSKTLQNRAVSLGLPGIAAHCCLLVDQLSLITPPCQGASLLISRSHPDYFMGVLIDMSYRSLSSCSWKQQAQPPATPSLTMHAGLSSFTRR